MAKWRPSPRQREILIFLRDQGEVFFWDLPWRNDSRLKRSLDILINRGMVMRGQTIREPRSQDLVSTSSYELTAQGRAVAVSL